MYSLLLSLFLLLQTPNVEGIWVNIDDATGVAKSEIELCSTRQALWPSKQIIASRRPG